MSQDAVVEAIVKDTKKIALDFSEERVRRYLDSVRSVLNQLPTNAYGHVSLKHVNQVIDAHIEALSNGR